MLSVLFFGNFNIRVVVLLFLIQGYENGLLSIHTHNVQVSFEQSRDKDAEMGDGCSTGP